MAAGNGRGNSDAREMFTVRTVKDWGSSISFHTPTLGTAEGISMAPASRALPGPSTGIAQAVEAGTQSCVHGDKVTYIQTRTITSH